MSRPAGLEGDSVAFAVMTEIGIIAHLADTAFARRLPDGLTTAQFAVLNHLMRLDTQQTIGELASALQVSQPTMSSTVRRLHDKELVSLVPDPDDRRIRRVAVTQAGRSVRTEAVRGLETSKARLDMLSEDEWKALLPLLHRLRVSLDSRR